MACYRPLTAYRATDGGITFKDNAASAANPLHLPCGRCIGCKIDRARSWALRCVHEAQLHDANSFVTLTYDDEHLPPDESLDVRDWQTFAKRLRKKIGPFRFFHCGEYGDLNLRPHYHALLFGEDFSKDRIEFKRNDRNEWIYTSDTLTEVWGLGFTTVAELTYQSAAYCARYTTKKITGAQAKDHYTRMDVETGEIWTVRPEYATMSRNKGLAHDWYTQYKDDVFPSDEVVHQAKRYRPPRYYEKQLDDQELETIKDRRRERIRKRSGDQTPERLKVRETTAQLKLQASKRRV